MKTWFLQTDKHLSEAANYSTRLILAILDINNLNNYSKNKKLYK